MPSASQQNPTRRVIFTYRDYLHLPWDKRYELIEGELIMVPAPTTHHQRASRNLEQILWNYVQEHRLGEVFDAPIDVVLSDTDVVQPDLCFVAKDRLAIITSPCIRGAPDLVIEILSPTSRIVDRESKYKLYEKYGVREYWLADPDAKTIEVFTLTDQGFVPVRTYPQGTHARSPLLPGLSVPIDEIFG